MNKYLAFAAQPWAMERERLVALLSGIHEHARQAATPQPETDDPEPITPDYAVVGGVALITLQGMILKTVPDWMKDYGYSATGVDQFLVDLDDALRSSAVRSILLLVDSPGGTVSGVQEAGDAVFAARGAKPIAAAVSDLCASAAYWIASQADIVTANLTAEVGSIGVYTYVDDFSGFWESLGIKTHLIASGPYKGVGAGGSAITEAQLAPERELINQLAAMFSATVARGRALDGAAARNVATGRCWLAPDAKALGLIDAVANLEEAYMFISARSDGPAAFDREDKAMRNPFAEFLARKFGKTAPAADTDAETTEVVEEEAEEEPQEPEGDEHGETAETDGDEGEAVPADDLDQADEDGQAPEPEAVSGAPAAEVTAEAPAAIAAAPERGSRELFQVLSARFGATFADRAIDAGWTYAEALEQRVIELETERANQAALIDKSGVLGEAATSSHAEEDPKAEARKIKAAELERKGLTRGQAAFAATLRFAPEVEQN